MRRSVRGQQVVVQIIFYAINYNRNLVWSRHFLDILLKMRTFSLNEVSLASYFLLSSF